MKVTSIRAWTAKDPIRAILAGSVLGGELRPYQRRAMQHSVLMWYSFNIKGKSITRQ